MTALTDKLRFKPGMRVCVIDAPAGYQSVLRGLPKSIAQVKPTKGALDLAQVFVTRMAQLDKQLPRLVAALKPTGILWVSYPKANGLNTDLSRDLLRATLRTKGLQAVAQVAVDEVWSALRFKQVGAR